MRTLSQELAQDLVRGSRAGPEPILRRYEKPLEAQPCQTSRRIRGARSFDRPLRQPHRSPGGDHVRVRQHARQNSQRHRPVRRACRMDSARNDEDSHAGHRHVPKLILAGRLTGTFDGRPVVISADDAGVTLDLSTLRSAWTLRNYGRALLPFLQLLKASRTPLTLRLAGAVSVPVLPKAGWLVRLFAPGLVTG